MSSSDELDEAFSDTPSQPETAVSGDEIDAAFSEKSKDTSSAPKLLVGGYPTIGAFKGAADVAISTARGMVNKPAASLAGAASAVND